MGLPVVDVDVDVGEVGSDDDPFAFLNCARESFPLLLLAFSMWFSQKKSLGIFSGFVLDRPFVRFGPPAVAVAFITPLAPGPVQGSVPALGLALSTSEQSTGASTATAIQGSKDEDHGEDENKSYSHNSNCGCPGTRFVLATRPGFRPNSKSGFGFSKFGPGRVGVGLTGLSPGFVVNGDDEDEGEENEKGAGGGV